MRANVFIDWVRLFQQTDIFFGKQRYKLSQIGNTFTKFSSCCKVQDLIKTARSLLAKIICFNKILIQACSKIPFRKNSCQYQNQWIDLYCKPLGCFLHDPTLKRNRFLNILQQYLFISSRINFCCYFCISFYLSNAIQINGGY